MTSIFSSFSYKVQIKNWRLYLRIIYFLLSIIIDIISNYLLNIKKINPIIINLLTWSLTLFSLCPYPLYKTKKQGNLVLKIFLYTIPFYMLFVIDYEGIFYIILYNYLQIWIKIKRDGKNNKKNKYNLIDIFIYMFLMYSCFFSICNVETIMNFPLIFAKRFISLDNRRLIAVFALIKALFPSLLVISSYFEIFKINNYYKVDSLIIMIALCGIMNFKFFFDIQEDGSWRDIGMSIAFFVISAILSSVQFIYFLFGEIIYNIHNREKSDSYQVYKDNKEIETKTLDITSE